MSGPVEVLWEHTDSDGDNCLLRTGDAVYRDGSRGTPAHLSIGRRSVNLDTDAARGLRDALNRLLVDDGGSAETGGRQATLEGAAYALHAAQHQQLEAAARWSARHVDEQAGMLARLADVLDPGAEADPSALLGTMHVILDVQRRTVASLGDLLAALAGQP